MIDDLEEDRSTVSAGSMVGGGADARAGTSWTTSPIASALAVVAKAGPDAVGVVGAAVLLRCLYSVSESCR